MEVVLIYFVRNLSLKISDGAALRLDSIADSFESKLDNVLDIFPLVFTLEKIVHKTGGIWVGT